MVFDSDPYPCLDCGTLTHFRVKRQVSPEEYRIFRECPACGSWRRIDLISREIIFISPDEAGRKYNIPGDVVAVWLQQDDYALFLHDDGLIDEKTFADLATAYHSGRLS